jgi:hypothetical protein
VRFSVVICHEKEPTMNEVLGINLEQLLEKLTYGMEIIAQ